MMELCENGDLRHFMKHSALKEHEVSEDRGGKGREREGREKERREMYNMYKQIRRIFKQLAEGLHYLHRRHIIHRDIKPSNLLLDANMNLVSFYFSFPSSLPSPSFAPHSFSSLDVNKKIADFGLSKQLNGFNDRCHTVCGTPNYISP